MGAGVSYVTTATRDSACAVCGETIFEGDAIAYLTDEGEWVHEDCAEQ